MSVAIVAKRYAQALLDVGSESGQLDTLAGDISRFSEAFVANKELQHALENPLVGHGAKKAIVSDVAQQLGLSQNAKNALGLLVDRRRVPALPYIARALRELTDAKKGIVRAVVTTAAPLSDGYYEKLKAQLERMTGKTIVLDKATDPQIIAGVVTRIGDRVFDGSLRTRLAALRETMMPT